ncbi:hypothetical protein ILYODFUR_037489 [Ilyodon furcidens]|uniref:Uncharacterized protein n=1 Tax=Ilyodon furcidens TaxID=33524 RepID=A0ABV0ST70_9TELE
MSSPRALPNSFVPVNGCSPSWRSPPMITAVSLLAAPQILLWINSHFDVQLANHLLTCLSTFYTPAVSHTASFLERTNRCCIFEPPNSHLPTSLSVSCSPSLDIRVLQQH